MRALHGLTLSLLLLAAALPLAAAQEPTTYEISGRVTSDTGAPIAGVVVTGQTYHEEAWRSSMMRHDDAVTNEEGRYTLELAAGKASISVFYEKWRRHEWRELVIEGARDDVDFQLQTPPPRTAIVEGIVRGSDGKPIEGAEVSLGFGCCHAYETREKPAEGNVTDVSEGASGGGSTGASGSTEPSPPAMSPEPDRRIMPPYHDDYQNTRTDSEGRYRFEAYAGPRQVTAWARGYAQTMVEVEARENATTTADLRLEKVPERDAVLTGRVLDAATGAPVANAHVSVRSLEWGRHAYDTTDADGRYRIESVPGWSEIAVSFWGHAIPMPAEPGVATDAIAVPRPADRQYYPYTTLAKLASGETTQDVKLAPKPKPTIALVGYVVDPDAKTGVAGAHVNVWNHETGDWGQATTDATGSYKILVRAGHYTINAWKEGHLSAGQTFVVTDDAAQRHDVQLPKGVTRWAPCYDEQDCGYAYAKAEAADGGAAPAPMPTPAVATAPSAARAGGLAQSDDAMSAASGAETSRAASFAGSGGDLPPYDPEQTGSIPAAQRETPIAEVPAPALGLVALALAGAALVAARRR